MSVDEDQDVTGEQGGLGECLLRQKGGYPSVFHDTARLAMGAPTSELARDIHKASAIRSSEVRDIEGRISE